VKRQLVRASIAAIDAVREVDPRTRIIHAEPVINVEPASKRDVRAAAEFKAFQFEATDTLSGRARPGLGGSQQQHKCEAVIHFAGLKSVAESVVDPTAYCDNNVVGTLRLVLAMQEAGVRKLVFSSSATVYGEPVALPISEDHPRKPSSPYGRTKMTIEDMLVDVTTSSKPLNVAILRYFNPLALMRAG
jgi:UDP-glucose 4-epimerase